MRIIKRWGVALVAIALIVVILKLFGFFYFTTDSERCIALIKSRDIKAAVRPCTRSAEQGILSSQYMLGVMYDKGKGVAQDHKEAVKWYRDAAERGYSAAQYNLGYSYYNGNGVVEDHGEALTWYRRAAEQGHTDAQYNLGRMYITSSAVLKDLIEAYAWFDVAATQGHQLAKKSRSLLAKDMTAAQLIEAERLSLEYSEKYTPSTGN